jgi:replicative DNA helicase
MGKTQLLVSITLNISKNNPVLFFSYDLSDHLLTNRFISSLSGISLNNQLNFPLSDEHKEKLTAVSTDFSKHKIFVNEGYHNSITAFKAHCKQMIEKNGIKVIVIDYLQMMSSNKYRHNRELEISYISRELKNIAKEFNVCVIVSSQLSRAVESRGSSKYPQLSDLRESGSIEQDADKVIFIYRPEYYGHEIDEDGNDTSGVVELILAKNRNGTLGEIKLFRNSEFNGFKKFVKNKNNNRTNTDQQNPDTDLF